MFAQFSYGVLLTTSVYTVTLSFVASTNLQDLKTQYNDGGLVQKNVNVVPQSFAVPPLIIFMCRVDLELFYSGLCII